MEELYRGDYEEVRPQRYADIVCGTGAGGGHRWQRVALYSYTGYTQLLLGSQLIFTVLLDFANTQYCIPADGSKPSCETCFFFFLIHTLKVPFG